MPSSPYSSKLKTLVPTQKPKQLNNFKWGKVVISVQSRHGSSILVQMVQLVLMIESQSQLWRGVRHGRESKQVAMLVFKMKRHK